MSDEFFRSPILNSPYEYPSSHWELEDGQPTGKKIDSRRRAEFITPIPKPQGRGAPEAQELDIPDKYDPISLINELRKRVDAWRDLPNVLDWRVTPYTARLLKHWRHHRFNEIRPFFCQIEAVEIAIWLTEVAPQIGKTGRKFLDYLKSANAEANPGLDRLALKLATGTGKTTVMSMLIAWQTVNAIRQPNSKKFTKGFLVVTPGLTIKDRLRVLQPNDPGSYYKSREIVPKDMLVDLERAKIIITNYHAFKRRDNVNLSSGGRALLKGRKGKELNTLETEGQMLSRVMPELMGMRNVLVINDEAHHCYREGTQSTKRRKATKLSPDEKQEAEHNRNVARLWISGLEVVSRKIGVNRVMDLSATPFFLSGSGYAEGTLFPWTMSDFSLMDAIECGIVKLPRVPVADNIPSADMPKFRELWEHIGKKMPKKGRSQTKGLDPLSIPVELQTALDALYGHYEKTFESWRDHNIKEPPCFIIVCNNTSTSKLVYDYVSGFRCENEDGSSRLENGRLPLFRNYDDFGEPLPRPNTLLVDSEQLESGEALDKNFRKVAEDEIERYRHEIIERTGDRRQAENLTDHDLLREVMNTVGKHGALGGNIRCVVSVSMLTEGWDANTVTHILGVRAFSTQLLCEQVVGRALRRQSYELENDRFAVEYADILGIPFDFTAKPVVTPPPEPRDMIQVKALSERNELEILFPHVTGYRTEFPDEIIDAKFNEDSVLELTPELTGPTITRNSGIIGESVDLNLIHTNQLRAATLLFHLTYRLLYTKWRDPNEEPKLHLFGQLKRITKQWLENCLQCKGGTYPAQLMYQELADMACSRIMAGIVQAGHSKGNAIKAQIDPYNPTGSTKEVGFETSKKKRWKTDPRRSHINWVVLDSSWEGEFCRVVEGHERVISYAKNQSLGLEVPYRYGSEMRRYWPDFIVRVKSGSGQIINLVAEIKGFRREDAKEKKLAMDTYWIPGVNRLKCYGRWAFAEFRDVHSMQSDFAEKVEELVSK